MSVETNRTLDRRWYEEVLNGHILATIDEIVAEDLIFNGAPIGRAGLRQGFLWMLSIIPDMHLTIEDVVAAGDKVVTRFTGYGTHQGPFMGVPPTGKAISMRITHIDRIADGKIVERWENADVFGVLQQLGTVLVPQNSE